MELRKHIGRIGILVVLVFSLAISSSYAQRPTGKITGTVTDDEGVPLPGVAVEISSPALMGLQAQVTVTSAKGIYRFFNLPPGVYKVVVKLGGFPTLYESENLRVSLDSTVIKDIALNPSVVEESITVHAGIPSVHQWHHYFKMPDTIGSAEIKPDRVESFDIAEDDEGNIYVSGVAKYELDAIRLLQKYRPDGTPVNGSEGSGTSWWYSTLYSGWHFPWHKLLIDNENAKIYVLFACVPTRYHYPVVDDSFVLSCHRIDSGEELWSVGIGLSSLLRAGIDIDSDGNVWTIIQEREDLFRVEKWTGNGNFIELANDGRIWAPNRKREFQAFGLRKVDNKIYLAFREEEPEPVDLVVDLWNIDTQNLQRLGRQNFTFEIPELSDNNPCWAEPAPDAINHPFFTDGFIDENGNFVVGGFYSYKRRHGGLIFTCPYYSVVERYYPVLVKFNSALNKVFEYIEMEHPVSDPSAIGVGYSFAAKVLSRNNSGALIIISSNVRSKIYEIDNDGNRTGIQRIDWFQFAYIPSYIPPASECPYFMHWHPRSFTYSYTRERIVITGPVKLWAFSLSCLGTQPSFFYDRFLTVSYFTPSIILPQKEPAWDFKWNHAWLDNLFWNPFDPPPWPPPLPWTRKFSVYRQTQKIQSEIFQEIRTLRNISETHEFSEPTINHLSTLFEKIPRGLHYTEALKMSNIKSLEEFKRDKKLIPKRLDKLIEAINCIYLDLHVPTFSPKKVNAGKSSAVDFQDIAWLTFKDIKESGKLSLKVESGLPALAKGFQPVWPIASYDFEFTGKLSKDGYVDVSFHTDRMQFKGPLITLCILQWNGKFYEDITKDFDLARKVITGRTNRLSRFVIMNRYNDKKTSGTHR